MARRFCGEYRIRLTFDDPSGDYLVTFATGGRHVYRCRVHPPSIIRRSVDHPIAFDEAAHAAMSFFSDDADAFDEGLAGHREDGSGWQIDRKAP